MLEEFKTALDIIQSLKSFFSAWSKSSPTQGQAVSSQLFKLQSFLGSPPIRRILRSWNI